MVDYARTHLTAYQANPLEYRLEGHCALTCLDQIRRDYCGYLMCVLTLSATRRQYLDGTTIEELISPDGWTLDRHFLDLPGRKQIQIAYHCVRVMLCP